MRTESCSPDPATHGPPGPQQWLLGGKARQRPDASGSRREWEVGDGKDDSPYKKGILEGRESRDAGRERFKGGRLVGPRVTSETVRKVR